MCLALLALPVPAAALDKHKAAYVSGPSTEIGAGAEGSLSTADAERVVFVHVEEIPYREVLDVEYGQEVKWLFGKKRRHFLTFSYRGQGPERRATLELGKDLILPTIEALEQRTGRRVVYLDDDAIEFRAENR